MSAGRQRFLTGFTIVEILIVVAIATSIIFVVSSFAGNLGSLQNLVGQKLQSRADIDETLQIMTTEIRSAAPASNGAYPIESAASSSFVFFSDIDHDGLYERVRYFLGASSTIMKGVTKPSGNPLVYATSSEVVTTAVNNVIFSTSTPLFSYYDSSYTGSSTPLSSPITVSAVRVVQIRFYADVNPAQAPAPIFFTSEITPRNLKSN